MVWMTIVSQLGYYKLLYGPQVLLQMNIAYFLPSIPLLGLSSFYDERMDQKFGMLDCPFTMRQFNSKGDPLAVEALRRMSSMSLEVRRCGKNHPRQVADRSWWMCTGVCSYSF